EKANLMIRGVAEPFVRTRWPYGELEQLPAPEGVVRLAKVRNPVLARLEIRDSALAAEIAQMTAAVMRARKLQRRARARVFIASVVSAVVIIVSAVVGIPEIANHLAPVLPRA